MQFGAVCYTPHTEKLRKKLGVRRIFFFGGGSGHGVWMGDAGTGLA